MRKKRKKERDELIQTTLENLSDRYKAKSQE